MFSMLSSVPVLPKPLGRLLEAARLKHGMKHEALATAMCISSQQLSKQIADIEHLSEQRLWSAAWSDEDVMCVWLDFQFGKMLAAGVDPIVIAKAKVVEAAAEKIWDVVRGRCRMAKAALGVASERKAG
jgi:hypothetical protein